MSKVLVTGGDGFVGAWTVRKLLERGYDVIITVRKNESGEGLVKSLQKEGIATDKLTYQQADLTDPEGWDIAMRGVDYVLHIASPITGEGDAIIDTAVKGVTIVLQAAIDAGVKKVVMTSSGAAAYPRDKFVTRVSDETTWTDVTDPELTDYMISKVYAEKAAWELVNKQEKTKLVTILPGGILGPSFAGRKASTVQVFQMMFYMPSPDADYQPVDVRDIAELHILAMENDAADGQRFLGVAGHMKMPEMAKIIKETYPVEGRKIKTGIMPTRMVKLIAKLVNPFKTFLSMIDVHYTLSSEKARTLLNWEPRDPAETIKDAFAYGVENHQL